MEDNYKINTRYAKALFSVAEEKQLLNEVYSDIMLVSEVFAENRQLMFVLKNPMIQMSKKISIISEIFQSKITSLTLQYIEFVIKKRRESSIPGIISVFVILYKEFKKAKVINVHTVRPFTASEKDTLTIKMKDFYNDAIEKIEIKETLEDHLIGGFQVHFDDYLYDASILNKIAKLKKEFEKNEYDK